MEFNEYLNESKPNVKLKEIYLLIHEDGSQRTSTFFNSLESAKIGQKDYSGIFDPKLKRDSKVFILKVKLNNAKII